MTRDEHLVYEELAAGYALDALEPEDEQLFLLHLSGCARCERELAEHLGTAAQLALAAGPTDLPDGLLSSLRAAVVAESGEDAFAAASPVEVAAPVVRLADRRRRLPRPAVLVSAAAGLALVLGLAGSNLALRHDQQQQLAWSDRLSQAVHAMGEEPGRNVPLVDPQQRVAAVAVLHDDRVSLVVDGMTPNDAAHSTYVLWEVTRFGAKQAVGTFDVRDGGVEVLRDLPLRTPASDVAAFAVTHEAGNTAPAAPRTAPLVSGAVQQA